MKNNKWEHIKSRKSLILTFVIGLFGLISAPVFSQQWSASVDSTSIKIGAQTTYSIAVEADTTQLVVFPEEQTFRPLEVIEFYPTDTTKNKDRYTLIKKYGLTQFDSGTYTIPKQKILIGTKAFFTDSLKVEVREIAVDTTKQGLYTIKPRVAVEKTPSKWLQYTLATLLILGLIGFLLYWFIWREKPLTAAEKIALLPPYERAKLALQELDKTDYLENKEIKEYYSELTGIIRKYLDEKVYDRSLESTTEELISRLYLLKEGNEIDLSKEDIKRINDILQRADLVKFAKSEPDIELAKLDRKAIDLGIDHVKESLPEPTEEELLEDIKYQEELAKKRKKKKLVLTGVIAAFLVLATFIGLGWHYGLTYVKDTIARHPSKVLLETKEWITSNYGAPSITITTPKVLERQAVELPEELKGQRNITVFSHGAIEQTLFVELITTKFQTNQEANTPQAGENTEESKSAQIDLAQAAEAGLKKLERQGVSNIITLHEKFSTPQEQEGIKTHGTASFPTGKEGELQNGKYILLGFTAENILQQVLITWRDQDVYAEQMVNRIVDSIELVNDQEAQEEE